MDTKLSIEPSEGDAGKLAVLLTTDDNVTPLTASDVVEILFTLKDDDGNVVNGREDEDVTANFDEALLNKVPPKNFWVYISSADTALSDQTNDYEIKRALFKVTGTGANPFVKNEEVVIIVKNIKSKSA